MFQNHLQFVTATIQAEASKYLRYAKALHKLDPELQKNPVVLERVSSMIDNYLVPDTQLGSALG